MTPACIWRDGCATPGLCHGAGCCQGIASNRPPHEREVIPSNLQLDLASLHQALTGPNGRADWLYDERIKGGDYKVLKAREDECRYIAHKIGELLEKHPHVETSADPHARYVAVNPEHECRITAETGASLAGIETNSIGTVVEIFSRLASDLNADPCRWPMLRAEMRGWLRCRATEKAPAPRRELSASERLHNICDALSEQADESPFTREEWDRIDTQTARLNEQVRVASHALGAIAGGDIYPQKLAREALDLMRGAVKASASAETKAVQEWNKDTERARCWDAVWVKLRQINPDFCLTSGPKSGLQCVLDEIERLATSQVKTGEKP